MNDHPTRHDGTKQPKETDMNIPEELTKELAAMRERVDGVERGAHEDRALLLAVVEAVVGQVAAAPESRDYLDDWEHGHRDALISVQRAIEKAWEGKS